MQDNETQVRLTLGAAAPTASGEFEILAITAGEGNGWQFSADTLRESVNLWGGIESFIDHHWFGHSVHDLAGVCHAPEWDEKSQGVKLRLKPIGPGAAILSELGKALLAEQSAPKPAVGFSADVVFTANGKKVDKILRVFSVDLVLDPARGGEFIREVYSKSKRGQMSEEIRENLKADPEQSTLPGVEPLQKQVKQDQAAVQALLSEQSRVKALESEAEKAREIRKQMCGQYLESALQGASLPAPAADRLRGQFADKVFEPAELQSAIEDTRKLISAS